MKPRAHFPQPRLALLFALPQLLALGLFFLLACGPGHLVVVSSGAALRR